MKFYNEDEIEAIVEMGLRNPKTAPYAQYLRDWVHLVNTNSDGWAYWKKGAQVGIALADLIILAQKSEVFEVTWKQRIASIERVALAQLKYGNKMPTPVLKLPGKIAVPIVSVWPECEPCRESLDQSMPAIYLAPASSDQGKTVIWVRLCAAHAEGYYDDTDWLGKPAMFQLHGVELHPDLERAILEGKHS